jgi:hypothetical protein
MTANGNMPTNHDIDASDLLNTLIIKKPKPRPAWAGSGTWVEGRIGGHRFQALVFPEHAECESYELDESRISKLWVQRLSDERVVVNFDRGWDVRPAPPIARQIVDLLAAGLAERIYNQ